MRSLREGGTRGVRTNGWFEAFDLAVVDGFNGEAMFLDMFVVGAQDGSDSGLAAQFEVEGRDGADAAAADQEDVSFVLHFGCYCCD